MEAFGECHLNWDVVMRLLETADARLLSQLSQLCRELRALASDDQFWHGCFGECFAVVPPEAKSWRERYKLRQTFPDYDQALEHAAKKQLIETNPCMLILPPGRFELSQEVGDVCIEGYNPNQYIDSEEEGFDVKEDEGQPKEPKSAPKPNKTIIVSKTTAPIICKYALISEPCVFRNVVLSAENASVCAMSHGVEMTFESCEFEGKFGILAIGAGTVVKDCKFRCSGHSVYANGEVKEFNVYISDCHFDGGKDGALYFGKRVRATVERCHIVDAGGSGAIDAHQRSITTIRDTKVENSTGLSGIFFGHVKGDESDDEEDDPGHSSDDGHDDEHVDEIDSGDEGQEEADESAAPKGKPERAPLGSLCLERVSVSGSRWNAVIISVAKASISESEFFRNGSIGIEISNNLPECTVMIVNCKIWDNAIDGLFAHQFADVHLDGNEIYNNKGKGVFISSDSKRFVSVTSNNIHNNGAGNLVLEPYQEVSLEERAKRRKGEISAVVLDAVASGRCTYLRTGPHYYIQRWWHCRTCRLVENEGCCEVCRETCHAGHDISVKPDNISIFFCDCGASGACKSVRAAQQAAAADGASKK